MECGRHLCTMAHVGIFLALPPHTVHTCWLLFTYVCGIICSKFFLDPRMQNKEIYTMIWSLSSPPFASRHKVELPESQIMLESDSKFCWSTWIVEVCRPERMNCSGMWYFSANHTYFDIKLSAFYNMFLFWSPGWRVLHVSLIFFPIRLWTFF
jgi:hypothetical protein